ncbi:hypothetical protein M2169_003387 [Streptomyces sp. MJP52]|nr:hypothetical protein [Streptomyces sp. MJP52]
MSTDPSARPRPSDASRDGQVRLTPAAAAHIRIARPSRALGAAARFWIDGLGLSELRRKERDGSPGGHGLLMAGWPDASWHLELTHSALAPVDPRPTEEDPLVIHCAGPVPEALVTRLEAHGGHRVTARNPYRDRWGSPPRIPTPTGWCCPRGTGPARRTETGPRRRLRPWEP